MLCPYCGHSGIKVIDKRESDLRTFRRRRECSKCKKRFTTFERVESLDILVVKKDGRRQPYDCQKLRTGLLKACEKRPISADQIDKLVSEIEGEVRGLKSKEVTSQKVGELVVKKLKKLDKVAYIRFASVYREFAEVADFEKVLAGLKSK